MNRVGEGEDEVGRVLGQVNRVGEGDGGRVVGQVNRVSEGKDEG